MVRAAPRLSFVLALAMSACRGDQYAKVVVVDPDRRATRASELVISSTTAQEGERRSLTDVEFPVSFILTWPEAPSVLVQVTALGANGVPLARGWAEVARTASASESVVTLGDPCNGDADCDNVTFCDGVERCRFGRCEEPPAPPCPDIRGDCYSVGCSEDQRACTVQLREDGVACGAAGTCRSGECVQ